MAETQAASAEAMPVDPRAAFSILEELRASFGDIFRVFAQGTTPLCDAV
jgi:hypothetical protein